MAPGNTRRRRYSCAHTSTLCSHRHTDVGKGREKHAQSPHPPPKAALSLSLALAAAHPCRGRCRLPELLLTQKTRATTAAARPPACRLASATSPFSSLYLSRRERGGGERARNRQKNRLRLVSMWRRSIRSQRPGARAGAGGVRRGRERSRCRWASDERKTRQCKKDKHKCTARMLTERKTKGTA